MALILEACALEDCFPRYVGELGLGVWTFPCGLSMSSQMAFQDTEYIWAVGLGYAHSKHHANRHTNNPWTLLQTREEQPGGWIRITSSCSCPIEQELLTAGKAK